MPIALLTTALAAATFASSEIPNPAPTRANEPIARSLSLQKAADFLDGVGVGWTRDRKCITCHTNMPYLLARPALPGDTGWKEVRAFLENDVASWSKGGKPRGDAYIIATALVLAYNDAHTTGQLQPLTRTALDRMWKGQKPSGEWGWLKCGWPPMEHDDYYGATLAAIATGIAPGKYAQTEQARAGIEKLKSYFRKTPAPDLHHKTMLLWASTLLPGLLTGEEQQATIRELVGQQHEDGGWSLPSLGRYTRRDAAKTPNDPHAPSDGYATGLSIFVLRKAGVTASNPVIQKGITWLKANQRESGRWYTRSLNNDRAHYITNAGSAFCVLALEACGELAPRK